MYQIKEFSQTVGLSLRMLRYIEDAGLLIPKRSENNYRIYQNTQVNEAKVIVKLQSLGFQLKEIKNLFDGEQKDQVVQKVLDRELDIAELKSDSIPELKALLQFIKAGEFDLNIFFETKNAQGRKMKSLWGEEKFHRTAYSIPILRNIYEDHIAIDANIELIATDLMKFGQWLEEASYIPEVFSAFNESSFFFGHNITEDFIRGYEEAWKRFLPPVSLKPLKDFTKGEVKELMGIHDVVIRTEFKYHDTAVAGQIIIPYTPIYTMTELKKRHS